MAVERTWGMPLASRLDDQRNFAVILSFAGLLATAGVAPGCDDISARSFGGNASPADGSAGGHADGGLVRGHGGTIAVGAAPVGAGGAPSAVSASSGGTAGAASAPAVGTGGQLGSGGAAPVSASGGTTSSPAPGAGTGGITSPQAGTGGGGSSMSSSQGGGGGTDDADQGGPDDCAKLMADYDTAVTKGKSCNGKDKGSACAKAVPAKLSGCGAACSTYVDDDSMVNMVRQKWLKAGCAAASCPVSLCISPTGGSCTSSSGDDKGTCIDTVLGL